MENQNLNNHEKEQAYKAQKEKMLAKYRDNIMAFYKAHNYDTNICFDMLVFNGHCFLKGATDSVIKGGGLINVSELIADVKILDSFTVWQ